MAAITRPTAEQPETMASETPDSVPSVDRSPVEAHESEPVNILIVDDESRNLEVLETVLVDPRYRLVRAESADEALLALVSEEFALIILDIHMPEMNGFELAELIKQRKKTADVPIIFLTAYYSDDQHVLEGYSTGAVDYLHKPINPTVLRSKVDVFVELYTRNAQCELAARRLLVEVAQRRRPRRSWFSSIGSWMPRVERTARLNCSKPAMPSGKARSGCGWPTRPPAPACGNGTCKPIASPGRPNATRSTAWSVGNSTAAWNRFLGWFIPTIASGRNPRFWPRSISGLDSPAIFALSGPTAPFAGWPTRGGRFSTRPAQPLRLIGTIIDISYRKETELQLLEADRRKNEFLATLAHELRNPLAPIRNAVQILLLSGLAVPKLQWAADVIDRQVGQMTRLVDDLLEVSRITTGKLEIRKETLDLADVIREAVETSQPLIEHDGHQLTVNLPSEPVIVDVDMIRMAQVFSNLLNNAAKYTEPGGRISISLQAFKDHALVSIKDSGTGIPAENFRTFSRCSCRSIETFTARKAGSASA